MESHLSKNPDCRFLQSHYIVYGLTLQHSTCCIEKFAFSGYLVALTLMLCLCTSHSVQNVEYSGPLRICDICFSLSLKGLWVLRTWQVVQAWSDGQNGLIMYWKKPLLTILVGLTHNSNLWTLNDIKVTASQCLEALLCPSTSRGSEVSIYFCRRSWHWKCSKLQKLWQLFCWLLIFPLIYFCSALRYWKPTKQCGVPGPDRGLDVLPSADAWQQETLFDSVLKVMLSVSQTRVKGDSTPTTIWKYLLAKLGCKVLKSKWSLSSSRLRAITEWKRCSGR